MNSLDHEPLDDHSHDQEELQSVFPLFKSWGRLYTFVLAELAVLILLFYLFSKAYA